MSTWVWLVWFFLLTLVIPWPAKSANAILVIRIVILVVLFLLQLGVFSGPMR